MKKYLVLLSTALLLTACLPGNQQLPQSPLLPLLERKFGLIAYIGPDGNIYTADQAGNNIVAHTDDALVSGEATSPFRYYIYPTWSPDSARLGFVGVSGRGTETSAEVFIADVEEETTKKVFESESEQPFYLYWSPDNTNLGFLSSTPDGDSLILQTVSSESDGRTIIDIGSPYYWSWAPDGKTMIVHAGSAQGTVPEHLSFLQVDSGIVEQGVESPPASFQTPAWSPDGSGILMTRLTDENEKEIILTDGRGEFEKVIGSYDLNTAFAWSNNSEMIGYIEGEQAIGAGALGRLHVMDVETSEEIFQDEDVYAFFWSPDDEMIAYFIPMISSGGTEEQSNSTTQGQQQLLLQLKILDVNSGESRELLTFRPTEQFSAVLPYFDQYHRSATFWSPDSNNLVLSFMTEDNRPGIAIVAASGQLEPRVLTPGYLAFWSWE